MAKTLIDRMVDRFLCWKLPKTFAPDAGINFTPYPHQQPDGPHWPIGTNLLTADEARQMFEHCLRGEGLDAAQIERIAKSCINPRGPMPGPNEGWAFFDSELIALVRAIEAAHGVGVDATRAPDRACNEPRLKPCPICGSDMRISDLGGWEVLCNNSRCGVMFELPDERHMDRELTIEEWNRRVTDGVDAAQNGSRADVTRNGEA